MLTLPFSLVAGIGFAIAAHMLLAVDTVEYQQKQMQALKPDCVVTTVRNGFLSYASIASCPVVVTSETN